MGYIIDRQALTTLIPDLNYDGNKYIVLPNRSRVLLKACGFGGAGGLSLGTGYGGGGGGAAMSIETWIEIIPRSLMRIEYLSQQIGRDGVKITWASTRSRPLPGTANPVGSFQQIFLQNGGAGGNAGAAISGAGGVNGHLWGGGGVGLTNGNAFSTLNLPVGVFDPISGKVHTTGGFAGMAGGSLSSTNNTNAYSAIYYTNVNDGSVAGNQRLVQNLAPLMYSPGRYGYSLGQGGMGGISYFGDGYGNGQDGESATATDSQKITRKVGDAFVSLEW